MAGIYIHIPFCKQACHYCNFHFSTSLRHKDRMLAAIEKELVLRKNYLEGAPIASIYLGGGTPSLLTVEEIQALLHTINQLHDVAPNAEITLEANPDDLNPDYLAGLAAETPVNRLSIGVQSLVEEDLLYMHRAHQATEALQSIRWAKAAGFDVLTADLIYGSPHLTDEAWRTNIRTLIEEGITHLSCYALTVEPQTALAHFIAQNKVAPVDEDKAARHFEILLEELPKYGFEQYEISNFCKPPNYAVHNSNYWRGVHYLGVGPAAHSFNSETRSSNVAHNAKYLKAIEAGRLPQYIEPLDVATQYNEYLLTALRTKWGVDTEKLSNWGRLAIFETEIKPFLEAGQLEKAGTHYCLTPKGRLLADHIISELFWV